MTTRAVRDGGPVSHVIDFISRRLVSWHFHQVLVAGVPRQVPPDEPVLYCANHVSWWDGFLIRRFHQAFRMGSLYTVMLEAELRRHPSLRRAGAMGLEPASLASVRALIRDLEERSGEPGVGVAFFPQGRIWPSYRRPLALEGGVRLVARALKSPWLVPVGLHIEPLNHRRPTAFVAAGPPVRWSSEWSAEDVEALLADTLDDLLMDLEAWGEEAAEGWTDRHESRNQESNRGPNQCRAPGER